MANIEPNFETTEDFKMYMIGGNPREAIVTSPIYDRYQDAKFNADAEGIKVFSFTCRILEDTAQEM